MWIAKHWNETFLLFTWKEKNTLENEIKQINENGRGRKPKKKSIYCLFWRHFVFEGKETNNTRNEMSFNGMNFYHFTHSCVININCIKFTKVYYIVAFIHIGYANRRREKSVHFTLFEMTQRKWICDCWWDSSPIRYEPQSVDYTFSHFVFSFSVRINLTLEIGCCCFCGCLLYIQFLRSCQMKRNWWKHKDPVFFLYFAHTPFLSIYMFCTLCRITESTKCLLNVYSLFFGTTVFWMAE